MPLFPLLIAMLVFAVTTTMILAVHGMATRKRALVAERTRQMIAATTESWPGNVPRAESGQTAPAGGVMPGILARFSRAFEGRPATERLESELQRAGVPLKGSELLAAMVIIAFIGSFIGYFIGGFLLFVVGGLAGFLLPRIWLKVKAAQRLKAFNDRLIDSLTMMSGALKAGYSFMQAMEMVAREMPPPTSDEFRRTLKELNLGASTEEALQGMTERVGSDDLELIITAVLIQRQVGGNLAEVLDNIADTVRDRIRIKGEIKTLTAQGRLSGLVIALLPVGIGGFIALINPDYVQPLFSTMAGRMMITVGVVGEIIAAMMIKKIVTIDI